MLFGCSFFFSFLNCDLETMEDWDQETLEKVVESKKKEYNQNKPTEIVCYSDFSPVPYALYYASYYESSYRYLLRKQGSC